MGSRVLDYLCTVYSAGTDHYHRLHDATGLLRAKFHMRQRSVDAGLYLYKKQTRLIKTGPFSHMGLHLQTAKIIVVKT